MLPSLFHSQGPRVFVIAVQHGYKIPTYLIGNAPCWLHNKAAFDLGRTLPGWIWWQTEKPPRRHSVLKDIIDENSKFDKDTVLRLIPERHQAKLNEYDTVYATGYRRTRHGKQQLELRFDGIAGCLRTPEGGSSKQYLVVKKNNEVHARLLTVREAARLMARRIVSFFPAAITMAIKRWEMPLLCQSLGLSEKNFLQNLRRPYTMISTEERLKCFKMKTISIQRDRCH